MSAIRCMVPHCIDYAFNLTITERSQTFHSSRILHNKTPGFNIKNQTARKTPKGAQEGGLPNWHEHIATGQPSIKDLL